MKMDMFKLLARFLTFPEIGLRTMMIKIISLLNSREICQQMNVLMDSGWQISINWEPIIVMSPVTYQVTVNGIHYGLTSYSGLNTSSLDRRTSQRILAIDSVRTCYHT